MTPTIDLLRSHRSIVFLPISLCLTNSVIAIIAAAQGASTSSFLQCLSIIRITSPALREKLVGYTGGQKYVASAAEFWVFCADFNRNQQINPEAELVLQNNCCWAALILH